MARRKWTWTDLQIERRNNVIQVANDLKNWWPLTLRQIYYQLVSRLLIKNTKSHYNMLSKLVKWMRIDDYLSWNVLEDRTRRLTEKRGYENMTEFVDVETRYFLTGYARCLVQDQDTYIEVWTEKDALFKIFEDITYPYCIRAKVCRGYDSVTFIADFFNRASAALDRGQKPIVLYFGDLDPSGVNMLEATIETLEDELGLIGVEFRRVALNPDQVGHYNLPHDPTAAKPTDKRYPKYVQKYGTMAVELDALHPAQLQGIIRNAIESVIDMDLFNEQQEIEQMERARVEALREDIQTVIKKKLAV